MLRAGLLFGGPEVGDFVVDVLLEGVGIGTDDAAAVDEDGGGAVNLEEFSVILVGVDLGSDLWAGQAGLEAVGIEIGAAGVVQHFLVNVGGRDEVLIVIDRVVELPERLGVLLVGTAASDGGGTSPGMQGVNGKVFEDELDLRVLGEQTAKGVVETAADGAFEVSVFDDGDGGVGIAEDRRAVGLDFGSVFGEGIGAEIRDFPADEVAPIVGDEHFDIIGAFGSFHGDGNFGQAGRPDGFGVTDGDLDV